MTPAAIVRVSTEQGNAIQRKRNVYPAKLMIMPAGAGNAQSSLKNLPNLITEIINPNHPQSNPQTQQFTHTSNSKHNDNWYPNKSTYKQSYTRANNLHRKDTYIPNYGNRHPSELANRPMSWDDKYNLRYTSSKNIQKLAVNITNTANTSTPNNDRPEIPMINLYD